MWGGISESGIKTSRPSWGAVVVELPVKNVNIRNVRNRGTGNAVIVTHPEGVTVSEVNKDGISNRLRPTDK